MASHGSLLLAAPLKSYCIECIVLMQQYVLSVMYVHTYLLVYLDMWGSTVYTYVSSSLQHSALRGNVHFPHFGETLYFSFQQVLGNPTLLQQGQQVDAELIREYPSGRPRVHRIYPRLHATYPPMMYRQHSHPQSPPQPQQQFAFSKKTTPNLERQIGKVDSEPGAKRSDSGVSVDLYQCGCVYSMYVCTYMHLRTYLHNSIRMYVEMYVCTYKLYVQYVRTYVRTCVHTYIRTCNTVCVHKFAIPL